MTIQDEIPVLPVLRSKAQARTAYDRISRWYDLISAGAERKYRLAGLALLDVQAGERVLEIGFGTGECLVNLAQSVGNEGQVCGLDLSEGMAKIARQRLFKAGLERKVELQLGDASKLPYEKETIDAIFMSFTLELFDTPEIPQVLGECRRVLRSGGRIALVTMAKKVRKNLAVSLYEWFHKKMPVLVDCRPISARPKLVKAGFSILSENDMILWGLPVDILLGQKSVSLDY